MRYATHCTLELVSIFENKKTTEFRNSFNTSRPPCMYLIWNIREESGYSRKVMSMKIFYLVLQYYLMYSHYLFLSGIRNEYYYLHLCS